MHPSAYRWCSRFGIIAALLLVIPTTAIASTSDPWGGPFVRQATAAARQFWTDSPPPCHGRYRYTFDLPDSGYLAGLATFDGNEWDATHMRHCVIHLQHYWTTLTALTDDQWHLLCVLVIHEYVHLLGVPDVMDPAGGVLYIGVPLKPLPLVCGGSILQPSG